MKKLDWHSWIDEASSGVDDNSQHGAIKSELGQ